MAAILAVMMLRIMMMSHTMLTMAVMYSYTLICCCPHLRGDNLVRLVTRDCFAGVSQTPTNWGFDQHQVSMRWKFTVDELH